MLFGNDKVEGQCKWSTVGGIGGYGFELGGYAFVTGACSGRVVISICGAGSVRNGGVLNTGSFVKVIGGDEKRVSVGCVRVENRFGEKSLRKSVSVSVGDARGLRGEFKRLEV